MLDADGKRLISVVLRWIICDFHYSVTKFLIKNDNLAFKMPMAAQEHVRPLQTKYYLKKQA